MAVDWKLCVEWLVQCKILPPDSKLAMRNGTLTDLALYLKDGVALCHLLNRIKPRSVDNKAFSHRPQTSQYLSKKNIKVFLDTCRLQFGLKDADLFEIPDLFDGTNFVKVVHTLYVLSNTAFAKQIATPIVADSQHDSERSNAEYQLHADESAYFSQCGFVEETFDDELNQIYDTLMRKKPQPAPDSEKMPKKSNLDLCIDELLTTEAKYVETLSMLIKYFLKPLQTLIQSDDLKKIFFGIEELHQVHMKFSADLEASTTSSNVLSAISKCFTKAKANFLIYADYCSNLLSAQDLLDRLCEHSPTVDVKIKECENKANEGQFKLRYMLAVPMQRVLKYHLLLQELIKRTEDKQSEKGNLEFAHSEMKDLSLYINEVKRDHEIVEQIDGIQRSISGLDMPQNTRLHDYGKLLMDGQLQVRHHDNRVNTRYIFLFDRLMLLCKVVKRSDSYEYKEFVRLQEYNLDPNIIKDKNFGRAVLLKSKDSPERKIMFGSRDETVLRKWWDAMHLAIDNVSPQGAQSALHDFVLTCIEKPRSCDVCFKLLRGAFFQGYRCHKTKMVVHKECIAKAQNMTDRRERPPPRLPSQVASDMLDVPPQPTAAALSVDYPDNFNRRRRKTEPSVWSPTDPGPPPTGCHSAGLMPHNYVNLPVNDDLSTYPWFCGLMRREDAHGKLELLPDGSFIVRRNPENGQYALGVRYRIPKHIRIYQDATSGQYYLTDHVLFSSIPSLVEYFQRFSLESYFSQEVPTALLHPYKTVTREMQDLAADKGFLAYCLALFDYAASETNQLSIAEYDVIGILDKAGDCHGWWRGYLHGRVGFFPKSYVRAEDLDQ